MRTKKLLSVVLAFVMVLSLLPMSALAANYGDTQGHWAEAAIDRWSGYGIVTGDERGFRPNDNMTRAEAAKVLCELFGLTSTAGAATFTDAPANAWFAGYIARANAAGIIGGVGDNQAAPNAPLTRETFFVMFARGLGLKEQSTTSGVAADGDSWANGYINALTDKGYVKGDGTGVNALANINRASVMSLLNQTIAQYVNTSGKTTLTADKGIVLVNAKNVTLTGTTGADVVIAQGASDGSVSFEKATVNGAVTVQATNAKVTADKDSKLASAPVVNGAGSTYTAADGTTAKPTTPSSSGGYRGGGSTTQTVAGTTHVTQATYGATTTELDTGKTYEYVVIDDSVGTGEVKLSNVTISKDLIINGGGSSTVILDRVTFESGAKIVVTASTAPRILLQSTPVPKIVAEKQATIEAADKNSTVAQVEAQANVTVQGDDTKVNSLTIPTATTTTTPPTGDAAPADPVTTASAPASVTVTVTDAEIGNLATSASSTTALNVDGATIGTLTANAGTTTIANTGATASESTINTVSAKANVTVGGDDTTSADQVKITNLATSEEAASAVTVTVQGGSSVANVTANPASDAGKANVTINKASVTDTITVPSTAPSTTVTVKSATVKNIEVNGAGSKIATDSAAIESITANKQTEIEGASGSASTVGTITAKANVEVDGGSSAVTVETVAVESAPASGTTTVTLTSANAKVGTVEANANTTIAATSGKVTEVVATAPVEAASAAVDKVTVKDGDAVITLTGTTATTVKIDTTDDVTINTANGQTSTVTVVKDSELNEGTIKVSDKADSGSTELTNQGGSPTLTVTAQSKTPTAAVLKTKNTVLEVTLAEAPGASDTIKVYKSSKTNSSPTSITTATSGDNIVVDGTKVTIKATQFSSATEVMYVSYTKSGGKESELLQVDPESWYEVLTVTDHAKYDVPASYVGDTIEVNFDGVANGGAGEYTYTLDTSSYDGYTSGWASLAFNGSVLTGTSKAAVSADTSVTVTVKDKDNVSQTLTITIGAVTAAPSVKPAKVVISSSEDGVNDVLTVTLGKAKGSGTLKLNFYPATQVKADGSLETSASTNKLIDEYSVTSATDTTVKLTSFSKSGSPVILPKLVYVTATYGEAAESEAVGSTGYAALKAATAVSIPAITIGNSDDLAKFPISLAGAVTGGSGNYTFSDSTASLPTGITVGTDGNAGKLVVDGNSIVITAAGTATLTVTDTASNSITISVPYGAISGKKLDAPEGLVGVAPTSEGGNGKIANLTTDMEIRGGSTEEDGVNFADWTTVTEAIISTGFTPGATYEVRTKVSNVNKEVASDPVSVTVPADVPALTVANNAGADEAIALTQNIPVTDDSIKLKVSLNGESNLAFKNTYTSADVENYISVVNLPNKLKVTAAAKSGSDLLLTLTGATNSDVETDVAHLVGITLRPGAFAEGKAPSAPVTGEGTVKFTIKATQGLTVTPTALDNPAAGKIKVGVAAASDGGEAVTASTLATYLKVYPGTATAATAAALIGTEITLADWTLGAAEGYPTEKELTSVANGSKVIAVSVLKPGDATTATVVQAGISSATKDNLTLTVSYKQATNPTELYGLTLADLTEVKATVDDSDPTKYTVTMADRAQATDKIKYFAGNGIDVANGYNEGNFIFLTLTLDADSDKYDTNATVQVNGKDTGTAYKLKDAFTDNNGKTDCLLVLRVNDVLKPESDKEGKFSVVIDWDGPSADAVPTSTYTIDVSALEDKLSRELDLSTAWTPKSDVTLDKVTVKNGGNLTLDDYTVSAAEVIIENDGAVTVKTIPTSGTLTVKKGGQLTLGTNKIIDDNGTVPYLMSESNAVMSVVFAANKMTVNIGNGTDTTVVTIPTGAWLFTGYSANGRTPYLQIDVNVKAHATLDVASSHDVDGVKGLTLVGSSETSSGSGSTLSIEDGGTVFVSAGTGIKVHEGATIANSGKIVLANEMKLVATSSACITGDGKIISGATANTAVNENEISSVTSGDANETYKISYTGRVGSN